MASHPDVECPAPARLVHKTRLGHIYLGDSLALFRDWIAEQSVDLIMTSPPFGLVRKKDYGNVAADQYVEWFRPFARAFQRALKPNGSLVIDIGGAWNPGHPTKSLYQYELLICLCREFGFHLAQEFFWWNPARLPTPAEWVTVRRIRVKDAVNCIWWLSPSPWPKASNRRVLQPYSESMKELLAKGYKPKLRPSGHDISDKFGTDNGAAIPPNLLAIAHTESNSRYIRYCAENGLKPHPARFPCELPEFFIRMLTDAHDLVVDPFAGSCVTGEAAEKCGRRWICCEVVYEYVRGAVGRFTPSTGVSYSSDSPAADEQEGTWYRVYKPGLKWNGVEDDPLPADGGLKRPKRQPRDKPHGGQTPRETEPVQMLLMETASAEVKKRKKPKKQ
ncbi:MAG: site-specific DNA-methyltransferase [Verrucomicrobiae bacterium]|nr:site-specific DNA-methyltransferase [Verrucomicrobiae bacterium]